MNRDQAKSYNPLKKPMKCDQLNEESKARLASMMLDIDENLEEIQKEKDEFYSADINKSSYTAKINDGNRAYLYSIEDGDRLDKINNSLMKITPMLLPADTSIMDQSK